MSEGRDWLCGWERTDSGFRAWVIARPKINGSGQDWQQTLDDLADAICDASGDGEPMLRFDPPEPSEHPERRWIHPDWMLVCANGNIPLELIKGEHFTGGTCEHCGKPIGGRNDVPLRADGRGEADLCTPWWYSQPYSPIIASERLLETFSSQELESFRVLRIQESPRTRTKYFELIPLHFVPRVAVRGWTVSGSACSKCARKWFLCTSDAKLDFNSGQLHEFAPRTAVNALRSQVAAFGDLTSWSLMMPTERARAFCRHKFARGARANPLAAVPPRMVDPAPKLIEQPRDVTDV